MYPYNHIYPYKLGCANINIYKYMHIGVSINKQYEVNCIFKQITIVYACVDIN